MMDHEPGELEQVLDGSYAIRAHTFALAAEDSFNHSNYKQACVRYSTARAYYDKIREVVEDETTTEALALLASFHKAKAKDMKRRAKAHEEASSKSQEADQDGEFVDAAPSIGKPSSSWNTTPSKSGQSWTKKEPAMKSVAAFQKVREKYEDLSRLMGREDSPLFEDESSLDAAVGIATSTSTNADLIHRVMGESFGFVPKALRARPQQQQQLQQQQYQQGQRGVSSGSINDSLKSMDDLQRELDNLRRKVEILTTENANLHKEMQRLQFKDKQEERIEQFKQDYRKRFAMLKLAMEHFQEAYAQGDNDGRRAILESKLADAIQLAKHLSRKLESEKNKRKVAEQRVKQLEQQLQSQPQNVAPTKM